MKELLEKVKKLYEQRIIVNKLQSLKIDDFRAFEKGSEINFNFPISVFVGKNGTGKSTVLKLLKTVASNKSMDDYFFETVLDDGDKGKNYIFSYVINEKRYINIKNSSLGWCLSDEYIDPTDNKKLKEYIKNHKVTKPKVDINDIEFKVVIGAFDKNLFFDNAAKSLNREQKVSYAIKQARKIQQNSMTQSNRKKEFDLTTEEIKELNDILGKNYMKVKL